MHAVFYGGISEGKSHGLDRTYIENHAILSQLRGRDFLALLDYTTEELQALLEFAAALKDEQRRGIPHPLLAGKSLAMLFRKASTRTRISFEVGIQQLGGFAIHLPPNELQIGRGETIEDTARVLSRYVDGIIVRTYEQQEIEDLAQHASIPIINGLTDLLHPCQVMADLLTIQERRGELKGLRLVYVGDGNNMAHSLMVGGAKFGMHVCVCTPEGFGPDPEILASAQTCAAETGGSVEVAHDPMEAAVGADILYTDVWVSMGQESEEQDRRKAFAGFCIDDALIQQAKSDVLVMHCMPAHRGEEITAEAFEGPHSVVFDQAENRLHAQKAIMAAIMR